MRVLLLSAYDAASHRYWRELLCQQLNDWEWQVLTLPGRHFSWRLRSNALTWAGEQRDILEQRWDLVLATSMVDLATLRGLVPSLANCPNLLYFHENQFAYPENRSRHGVLELQMTSLYSALAADRLLFNSDWNRDSFLLGCDQMLRRFPDGVPPDCLEHLRQRSQVLPVPIRVPASNATYKDGARQQLLWNHRWEYDKGPAQLLELVELLLESGLDFDMHVVGQQFRQRPAEFERVHQLLQSAGRLGCWGYIESRDDYEHLLGQCDVVISTALHDFQGLSVLEACAAGAAPLVPNRLVYPEWFGADACYTDTADAVHRLLTGGPAPCSVEAFTVQALIPDYRELAHSTVTGNSVS